MLHCGTYNTWSYYMSLSVATFPAFSNIELSIVSSEFSCEICSIQFLFKSKYLCHLKSTSYQWLQCVLNIEDIDESTDHDVAMETEVTWNVISEDTSSEAATSDDNDLHSFTNIEVINTNFIHGNMKIWSTIWILMFLFR